MSLQQPEAAVWGEHRTPAGQPYQWCAEQGELFIRTDALPNQGRNR